MRNLVVVVWDCPEPVPVSVRSYVQLGKELALNHILLRICLQLAG